MTLHDLVDDKHQTDWESITCPNCQTHEQLKVASRNSLIIVCENEGCRVSTFRPKEENR